MNIIIGKSTSVSLAGIDLSPYLTDSGFELSPWQKSILDALPGTSRGLDLRPRWSLTFAGTLDAAARAYFAALFEARRRRLSRMHSAYRSRRR